MRFSRCSAGAPGIERRAAAAIERCLERGRERLREPRSAGFGAPSGGIMPVRSLRTTFSHVLGMPVDVRGIERIEREAAGACARAL